MIRHGYLTSDVDEAHKYFLMWMKLSFFFSWFPFFFYPPSLSNTFFILTLFITYNHHLFPTLQSNLGCSFPLVDNIPPCSHLFPHITNPECLLGFAFSMSLGQYNNPKFSPFHTTIIWFLFHLHTHREKHASLVSTVTSW